MVVGDNQIPFGHSLTLWVSKLVLKRGVSAAASCLVCMRLRRLWHSLKILDLKNFFLLGKVKKNEHFTKAGEAKLNTEEEEP